ncbi:MAG TPA: hypothetical protein VGI75_01445 [Pirellulales bacterium]|jgi:hypothetical protein
MRFTVIWVEAAERALASAWIAAVDRDAVVSAANAIDTALQVDPASTGESREFDQRIVFAPPLAAIYSVNLGDRLVNVRRVWTIERRRNR